MRRNADKAQFAKMQSFDARDMVATTVELTKNYLVDHPDNGAVWLRCADSLRAMARYPEALFALRRTARLAPSAWLHLVYYCFGHLHRQKGTFRIAERWYRRAVELHPSSATSHIFLGALLAQTGRLQEAEAVHRHATHCEEGSIDEAFHNLGLVLRALGRFSEARKCFKRALEIDAKYKAPRKELLDVEQVIKEVGNV